MASDALTTGAATRAPRDDFENVSASHTIADFSRASMNAQADAEIIEGMVVAIEVMHEKICAMIIEGGGGAHLARNEVWESTAVLLTTIRTCGHRISQFAKTIECAGMSAKQAVSA